MQPRLVSARSPLLQCTGVGRVMLSRERSTPLALEYEHGFVFVLKGNMRVSMQRGSKAHTGRVLSGELFYVLPGSRYMLDNLGESSTQLVFIYFTYASSADGRTDCESAGPLLLPESAGIPLRIPQMGSWIEDFLAEDRGREMELASLRQSHLYGIFAAFLSSLGKPSLPANDLYDYVERTKRYWRENYNAATEIEEFARLSGVSSGKFYQAFKAQTGLSPNKFVTTVRLNASLSLLAGSSFSIAETAHAVGYADEFYFSRLFRKHMSMSPTEYAAAAKKRIACLSPVLLGDLHTLGIVPEIALNRGWSDQPDPALKLLAGCRPELILTGPLPDELHGKLSAIAPVVMLHWKGIPWKERLLQIGELLGLRTVAQRWLRYFESKADNARRRVRQQLGQTPFLLVHASENGFTVFGMRLPKMKDLFYDDLQIKPPEAAYALGFFDAPNLHAVAALDCDHLLLLVHASMTDAFCRRLEEEWLRLKPGRSGRLCLFVRHEEPLLYNPPVHESLVDQTVNLLLQDGRRS